MVNKIVSALLVASVAVAGTAHAKECDEICNQPPPVESTLMYEMMPMKSDNMYAKSMEIEDNNSIMDHIVCTDGDASGFPCQKTDLYAFLGFDELGGPKQPGEGYKFSRGERGSLNERVSNALWHPVCQQCYEKEQPYSAECQQELRDVAANKTEGAPCDNTRFVRPDVCSDACSENPDSAECLAAVEGFCYEGNMGSDIWGWTDAETGREYALHNLWKTTAFVDVTDAANPVYLGKLRANGLGLFWHDVKVYKNYAFIGSEAPGHGIQIFDLTRLRDVTTPQEFTIDAQYGDNGAIIGDTHNVVINEESGYMYLVGSFKCRGGPHIVDIREPLNPTFVGCFDADNYTHDAQCVNYVGPDLRYQDREICVLSNEDSVTIADVTDKDDMKIISRTEYEGSSYAHQGWLTTDHKYFFLGDELDELDFGHNTRTYGFDVTDLENPTLPYIYTSPFKAIDHNMYTKNVNGKDFLYQADYTTGLIVFRVDTEPLELVQVAQFDVFPENDDAAFTGAWSIFPYFESGTVLISSIDRGLFVVRVQDEAFGIEPEQDTCGCDWDRLAERVAAFKANN